MALAATATFAGIHNHHYCQRGDYTWNDVGLPVPARRLRDPTVRRYDVRINWIHTARKRPVPGVRHGLLDQCPGQPPTGRWRHRTGVVKLTYLQALRAYAYSARTRTA